MRFPIILIFLFILGVGKTSFAQQKSTKDSLSVQVKSKPKQETKEVLGTSESLKFVGNNLLFQLKKRLHLTTKDEENQEQKRKKKVVLTIGGIKIEN